MLRTARLLPRTAQWPTGFPLVTRLAKGLEIRRVAGTPTTQWPDVVDLKANSRTFRLEWLPPGSPPFRESSGTPTRHAAIAVTSDHKHPKIRPLLRRRAAARVEGRMPQPILPALLPPRSLFSRPCECLRDRPRNPAHESAARHLVRSAPRNPRMACQVNMLTESGGCVTTQRPLAAARSPSIVSAIVSPIRRYVSTSG